MKHLLILLVLFLISEAAYAQDLDKIKAQDILILFFDSQSNPLENKRVRGITNDTITINYSYKLRNSENNLNYLKVCYSTYMNSYAMSIDEKTFQMRINKSFLRKNKDIIVTRDFMEKLGYEKAATLLRTADRILLIDNADTKDNKSILLRQVRLLGEIII